MTKLLTLNTHSLIEVEYEKKLNILAKALKKYKPNIVALQEVMQPKSAAPIDHIENFIRCGKIAVKKGNHCINIVNKLNSLGLKYNSVWLGINKAYDLYEEGLCFLCDNLIESTDVVNLSSFDDYDNWKTRKALGIKVNNVWYYNVHLGWWNDEESPSKDEIQRLNNHVNFQEETWLLGDFNSPDNEQNTGYDLLCEGWFDTYHLAQLKDDGITVEGQIDGWKNKNRKRIDYIFTNRKKRVISTEVIFNGKKEQIISDHYGILLNFEEE